MYKLLGRLSCIKTGFFLSDMGLPLLLHDTTNHQFLINSGGHCRKTAIGHDKKGKNIKISNNDLCKKATLYYS